MRLYSAITPRRLQKFWIYVQLQTHDLNGSPTAIGGDRATDVRGSSFLSLSASGVI